MRTTLKRRALATGLAPAATLLLSWSAAAIPLVPGSGTGAGKCGAASSPPSNWTCIASNFNGTSLTNPEYVWFTMHLTKVTGLPATGGTVYFRNQYITVVDASGNFQFAMPDGSITYVAGSVTPSTMYDASGWHTTVSMSSAGQTVFMAALAQQVPPGAYNWSGANPVTWEGIFSYGPTLTGPIGMSWQWSAASYVCGGNTACQAAFGGDYNALGVRPTTNGAGTPVNYEHLVVGGARGGGGSNFTGSWSATATATGSPLPPPTTVPEPSTVVLLGTGFVVALVGARRRLLGI